MSMLSAFLLIGIITLLLPLVVVLSFVYLLMVVVRTEQQSHDKYDIF